MQGNSGSVSSLFFSILAWIGAVLRKLFADERKRPAAGPVAAAPFSYNPDPDYSSSLEDVPRYPPFDRGLPAIPVARVLETQRALVDRIKQSELPFVDEVINNLAAYVHLLPATSNDVFNGAGGLLRLCLETGFHSYVASQGNIFTSRDPAEKRRFLEPKWQLAAFLAGLCCELGRAIHTSVVTNDRGEQWLPFEPLTLWLERTGSQRYFLRPPQSSDAQSAVGQKADPTQFSGIIVNGIIPAAALQHITTDDRSILMEMLTTISRVSDTFHTGHFARTVRHIRDQVIARDQKSSPRTFGVPLVGTHVEPYLIDAMRHLVKNGTWKRNDKLARVHLAQDGCFIFWSTGVPEILELLRQEGAVGIPTDPRTLGELLVKSRVLEANGDSGLWWYIKPPGASTFYEVVKLSNPGIILEEQVIAETPIYPVAIAVERQIAQTSPSSNASSPAQHGPASQLVPSPLPATSKVGQVAGVAGTDPQVPPAAAPAVSGPSPAVGSDQASPETYPPPFAGPSASQAGLNQALSVVAGIQEPSPDGARPASAPSDRGTTANKPRDAQRAPPKPRVVRPKPDAVPAQADAPFSASSSAPAAPAVSPVPGTTTTSDAAAAASPPDAAPEAPAVAIPTVAERLRPLLPSTRSVLKTIASWHNDPTSSRKGIWDQDALSIPVQLVHDASGERGSLFVDLRAVKAVVLNNQSGLLHRVNEVMYFKLYKDAALHLGFTAAAEA